MNIRILIEELYLTKIVHCSYVLYPTSMRSSQSFCYTEFQIIEFRYAIVDCRGIMGLYWYLPALGSRARRDFNGMRRILVWAYPAHPPQEGVSS